MITTIMHHNVNLFIDQRHDLINELVTQTKDKLFDILRILYLRAKDKNRVGEYIVRDYQLELKTVASWTVEEIKQFSEPFRFDYHSQQASDVVCGIYPLLDTIHSLNQELYPSELYIIEPSEELDIVDNFLKVCMLNIAREVWKKAYLMYEIIDRRNYSQYSDQIERIIVHCIKATIRRQSSIETVCKQQQQIAKPYDHDESQQAHQQEYTHDVEQYLEEASVKRDASLMDNESVDTDLELKKFIKEHTQQETYKPTISRSNSNKSIASYHSQSKFKHDINDSETESVNSIEEDISEKRSHASSSKRSIHVKSDIGKQSNRSSSSGSYAESHISESDYETSSTSIYESASDVSESTLESEPSVRINKTKRKFKKSKMEQQRSKYKMYNTFQDVSSLLNTKAKKKLEKVMDKNGSKQPSFFG